MKSFMFSAWLMGLRSRSIKTVFVLAAMLVVVAYLSAHFSPRQPQTVALDVGFSGLRFSLILFALFWVQELVGREIEQRTVIFALTYPVPRSSYILGRYFGILGLLALAALVLALAVWLVVLLATRGGFAQGFPVNVGWPFVVTVIGLWIDAAVVAAFALCLTSFFTAPTLPFGLGLVFAAMAKSLGAVLEYMGKGAEGGSASMDLAPVLNVIQWIVPDLSRLDWRAWPMYNLAPDMSTLGYGALLGVSYALLLVTLAAVAFTRRQFH